MPLHLDIRWFQGQFDFTRIYQMIFFINILETVGPILLLLGAGILIRKKRILSGEQVDGLQVLIVKFALPSALFLTFLKMELKLSLIALPGFAFFLCALTYVFGHIRLRKNPSLNPAFPYMMSSFEFGMLGLILFTAAFGAENLGKLAITALGQEFFVWFIMVPHVSGIAGKAHSRLIILKSFITNPALIAIFIGLILNISEYAQWGTGLAPFRMIMSTLNALAGLIVPSILIFIGYGMVVNRDYIKETGLLILQRLSIMLIPMILFIYFIVHKTFELDHYYSLGIITLFLLPPPFIIPLFLDEKRKALVPRINGIMILYTIFTVITFCILAVLSPR